MLAGPANTVRRARKLRRSLSVPEIVLWTRLRVRPGGFKFRRQHPAGSCVLDFFCNEAKLAVEVHGMGDRPARDAIRDAWLAAQGIATLRIAAIDMSRHPDGIIATIVAACRERGNPLHHPADGPPPVPGRIG